MPFQKLLYDFNFTLGTYQLTHGLGYDFLLIYSMEVVVVVTK